MSHPQRSWRVGHVVCTSFDSTKDYASIGAAKARGAGGPGFTILANTHTQ
jgi:hypothetical protein